MKRFLGGSVSSTCPRARTCAVVVLVASLTVVGCSAGPPAEVPAPTAETTTAPAQVCAQRAAHPAKDASLDQLLTRLTADTSGGVVIALGKGGEPIRFCAAGRADRAERQLETGDAFRIGSITKTFVAVLVIQLVEEGRLDLTAPVESVLPGVPWTTGVTVEQLLNHTSGIPNFYDALYAQATADRDRLWTPQEVLALVGTFPRRFEPGADQEYSNSNYLLLGMVLESVTGQPWTQLVQERIVVPLGLTRTGAGGDAPEPVTGFSTSFGVDRDSEGISYRAMATGAGAAGSMVSTAPDLVTFFTALAGGDLVSQDSLNRMRSFVPSDEEAWYGLGLGRVDFPSGDGFGHSGEIPGYTSLAAIRPESGDLVVILTNDDNTPHLDLDRLFAAW
ncbi:serine hydrolase [Actinotalea sp. Marseille-Q4924]|uniref:serine hydrolase domain-containing protein n=1 Tax=Actinotalea sp. Marseille-Q4924 TaxID=2866571 RepID=UPI001CE47558|nr:serine hydrolase domain-containing protein [Actinotalea sp. Marseille-Q4924]